MKTLKRFFILLMVAVMLMTTFLTACADPTGPNDQETTPPTGDAGDVTTPAEGGEVTTPADTEYDPLADLAVEDFGDYTFNILTPSRTWAIVNMTAEDMTGDTIQDAIYERQMIIEDRLNINMEELITTDDITTNLMSASMQSG